MPNTLSLSTLQQPEETPQTLMEHNVDRLGILNGRLYDIRCRLGAAIERLDGPVSYGGSGDAVKDAPSGSAAVIHERLDYAHAHASDMEELLTVLERIV